MSQRSTELGVLLQDVATFLRYQGELGLSALPGGEALLLPRRAPKPVADVSAEPASEAASVKPLDLDGVRSTLGDCERCKLHRDRTHIVFGVGSPSAELMLVGEGPGRDEDLQGEPFVGVAGQLLDRMIEAMGLGRADVYIANIVKCRPPRNRNPEPDEVEACEPFLKQQIAAVQPKVIVALGKYAAQTLLGDGSPISRMRGRWRAYEGIDLMPTYHPAYLLRNPREKRPVWEDLKQVMTRLGLKRL